MPPPASEGAGTAPPAAGSKTKKRRALRKKRLALEAAAASAPPPDGADGAASVTAVVAADDAGGGGVKPPSTRKRRRAALEAATAAALSAAALPPAALRSGGGDGAAPPACDTAAWAPFGLHPWLRSALGASGFASPTPVQAGCLPPALAGRDVVGAAPTGSGKTLAFGLPVLHFLACAAEAEHPPPRSGDDGGDVAPHSGTGGRTAVPHPLVALVLCPTRELAMQVASHIGALGSLAAACAASAAAARPGVGAAAAAAYGTSLRKRFRAVALVGGLAPSRQARLLATQPPVVVATPGRLWELVAGGDPHLSSLHALRFLIIDEADRMVEKGHFAEVRSICDAIETGGNGGEGNGGSGDGGATVADAPAGAAAPAAPPRQTFVFSATMCVTPAMRAKLRGARVSAASKAARKPPSALGSLLERVPFQGVPQLVDVSSQNNSAGAAVPAGRGAAKGGALQPSSGVAPRLEEACLEGTEAEREAHLVYLLTAFPGRTLVFCNAISAVRRVAALLTLLRIPAHALHAQQSQKQRLRSLDAFSSCGAGASCALVATDVAARGLDIPNVRTVVHYQVPLSAEAYVHRSGRTARATADGLALLLVTPGERSRFASLCVALGRAPTRGFPRFPTDATALRAASRRAAAAVALDGVAHARSKRAGDAAWRAKAAAAADLVDEEAEEAAARGGGEGRGGGVEKPGAREVELRSKLDALLATPLFPQQGGSGGAGGTRRFPRFGVLGASAQPPASASAAAAPPAGGGGGTDALAALRAHRAAAGGGKKKRKAAA